MCAPPLWHRTSSWAPCVVHASRFLRDDGRLAFVLPAELLQVDYAKPDAFLSYVALLHSSIALLSFELEGRSYGGGVVKLETKEAERAAQQRTAP